MKRAAIYSRFSTDLQSEGSIEDQAALCRAFAAREGLEIVGTYEDRARSGGSMFGRDGLMEMMQAAQARAFEVLVVEALDRLSRDMEDLAGLHKRLTFLGIEIRAVHEGPVNTVLVGLRGLVGQLYREDNAHKVRRGMAGVIRAGRAGGGRAYGYDIVPGERGRRIVNEAEAAIVRRIFAEFLAGRSPRAIAAALNAERVAPPRGRTWNASTVTGSAARGNGILRNEIYAGRLVWNKIRMLKNPDTGRRVSRPNPPADWQTVEVPELAIVSREDFEAVRAMKRGRAGVRPERQQRGKHLLSGLLRCAACGGGMTVTGKDKSGRRRLRCSNWVNSRTCPDPHSFYLDRIEAAAIDRLREEMLSPTVTAEYVRTYREERKRLAASADAARTRLERRIETAGRDLERLVDAIAGGHGDAAVLGPRATALHREREALREELSAMAGPVNVVALHPAVLARYAAQLEALSASLARADLAGDPGGRAALHELLTRVTVHRDDTRRGGFRIEIHGRMAALLGPPAPQQSGLAARVAFSSLGMVAEDGFEPPTRGL